MSGIVVNHDLCSRCGVCINKCPFNALSKEGDKIEVNANCKMCKVCIQICPMHAISIQQDEVKAIDKSNYHDILVYVEHLNGVIHPVTYELIGKALQLAKVIHQNVNCLFVGKNIRREANELLHYGVNKVFVYEDQSLKYFKVDNYANVFEDCIRNCNPVAVLVGATSTGRSLAPRVATRFRTGLTADCTVLEMRENTDLVQIRPAFGGNIMAQILTTNHRPQFATVRYKVMDHAKRTEEFNGEIIDCKISREKLDSKIKIEHVEKIQPELNISEAEMIVVAGAGVKDEKGLALVEQLAAVLHGMVGVTRPLVERGMGSYLQQIGLSGRTVKPKLIITCGVSGAIQFVAGMNNAEMIFAIDQNPNAPIFSVANYAVVGDLYEILPILIAKIEKGENHEI